MSQILLQAVIIAGNIVVDIEKIQSKYNSLHAAFQKNEKYFLRCAKPLDEQDYLNHNREKKLSKAILKKSKLNVKVLKTN